MRANKNHGNRNGRSYHPHRATPQYTVTKWPAFIPCVQELKFQQEAFLGQPGPGPAGVAAVGGDLSHMPIFTVEGQMQAAFLDYQLHRVEFEKQQHQRLFERFNYYPFVPGAQIPTQVQPQAQQQQQPAEGLHAANGFVFQRQPFLQPEGSVGPAEELPGLQCAVPNDFFPTPEHMGFMQQQQQQQPLQQHHQHQDVFTDQQQVVATNRQGLGMAVFVTSVPRAPRVPLAIRRRSRSWPE